MSESPAIFRQRQHIPELDGLRGLAVLLVLWGHLKMPVLSVSAPNWFHVAVDLFFILSGFLITRILLFNRDHDIPLSNFFARRAARILPAALITVAAIAPFWPSQWNAWAAVYLLNVRALFVGLDNAIPISHFWSLCVEEQFYLISPFVVSALSLRWGLRMAIMGCCVALLLTFAGPALLPLDSWHEMAANNWVRLQFFTRGWLLMLGAVFAYCEPDVRARPWLALMATALCLAIALSLYALSIFQSPTSIPLQSVMQQIGVTSVFTYAIWLSFTNRKNLFTDWLLGWCGKISYGLYLYHLPIYYAVRKLNLQHIEAVIFAVGITFAVASASFYLFEQPILNRVRKSKAN